MTDMSSTVFICQRYRVTQTTTLVDNPPMNDIHSLHTRPETLLTSLT